jgi:hypothetical protein
MVVPLAAEVIVHPLPVSRNEPAWIHIEVGVCVDQELPFTVAVSNRGGRLLWGGHVPPVISAASMLRRCHHLCDVVYIYIYRERERERDNHLLL